MLYMNEYKRRLRKLLHDSGEFPCLNMFIVHKTVCRRRPHDRHTYNKVLEEELHVTWEEIDRGRTYREKVVMGKQFIHRLLSVPKEDLPMRILQRQEEEGSPEEHKLIMAVYQQRLHS